MSGPLSGVKVLEIASVVLGPLACQYLGDMGAEVIKVEAPEGDITRVQGPHRSDRMMSALFLSNNRNKRGVMLDLKRQEDREALNALVRDTDVLIHSIRTQAAEKVGLSYAELSKINPKLIYCHVKGFSDKGTYAGKPAYDDIIQGLSGLAAQNVAISGEPRYIPAIIPDKLTGVHAAYAIVLALYHRLATGRGQQVDVPMFETMAAFNLFEHQWGACFEPTLQRVGYPTIANATRRPFKTKDGYVSFLPHTDAHWRRFLNVIDRAELLKDDRFATFVGRQANADLIWTFVKEQMPQKTSAEWIGLLQDADVPIAVVNTIEDLLDDPHLNSIGFWTFHEHPTEGTLRMAGLPISLSDSPAAIRRLPPKLGEHTEEVLREHGCPEQIIQTILDRNKKET